MTLWPTQPLWKCWLLLLFQCHSMTSNKVDMLQSDFSNWLQILCETDQYYTSVKPMTCTKSIKGFTIQCHKVCKSETVNSGNKGAALNVLATSWSGESLNYQNVWVSYIATYSDIYVAGQTDMHPVSDINDKQVIHPPVIQPFSCAWGLGAVVYLCRAQRLLASCQWL